MWDLVPRPGIKPGPPALRMQSLSYWTTREVPQVSEWWGCGENVICLNSRTAACFPQLRPLFRSTLESSCEWEGRPPRASLNVNSNWLLSLPLGWELADDCRASVSSFVGGGRWARRRPGLCPPWGPQDPPTSHGCPTRGLSFGMGCHSTLKLGQADSAATSAGLQKWGDKLQICIFLLIVCQSSVGQKLKEENWSGYRRRGGCPPMSSLARSTLGSFPSCKGRGRNSPVRMVLNVRDESFPSLVYFSVLVSDLLPHRET